MPVSSKLNANGKPQTLVPEKFLEQAVESSLNAILVYDLQRENTVFVNRQFTKITGYSFDEMKSLNRERFLALIHPKDRNLLVTHWGDLMKAHDETEYEIEYRLRAKTGAWIWCLSRDTVFERDENGNVSRYIGVFLDITERKELEQRLKDQKQALDAASIVAETDLDGRITYVNDTFCAISKYSRDELIGKTHRVVSSGYHPKEFFSDLWTTIKSGRIWKGEIRNRAKDGTYYWVDTTIMPFKDWDGRIYKYVAVRHEVTKEKEYQYQLQKQIEVAKRALNSADLKGRFLSEMSHEVRNNLNCILGFSQLLLEGDMQESDDFLKRIKRASEQTLGLMNNVLDALRLESSNPALDKSPAPLGEIIADAIDISRVNIENKRLHLKVDLADDLPKLILCDRHRLTQVFLNLLSNATKYTDKGEISFSAHNLGVVPDEGSVRLRFSVADTGRGIPKEKLNSLFREFEQCSPKDAGQGTGLGLSICKRTVELMGGKIWAESLGKGSKFSLEITVKIVSGDIELNKCPKNSSESLTGYHH